MVRLGMHSADHSLIRSVEDPSLEAYHALVLLARYQPVALVEQESPEARELCRHSAERHAHLGGCHALCECLMSLCPSADLKRSRMGRH